VTSGVIASAFQFLEPDVVLKSVYEKEPEKCLLESRNDLSFIVTRSLVISCISKLHKKNSRRIDSIWPKHLEAGSPSSV